MGQFIRADGRTVIPYLDSHLPRLPMKDFDLNQAAFSRMIERVGNQVIGDLQDAPVVDKDGIALIPLVVNQPDFTTFGFGLVCVDGFLNDILEDGFLLISWKMASSRSNWKTPFSKRA